MNFDKDTTPLLKRTFELAEEIAFSKGFDRIGEEHLLLAMMKNDGVGGQLLKECGIEYRRMDQRIEEIRRESVQNWIDSIVG